MPELDDLLEVKRSRELLDVSQQELADLLGVSTRTIQACEQGWRKPSAALEKSLLLLHLTSRHGSSLNERACWERIACDQLERCLVYRSRQGHLCWLLSGTSCRGQRIGTWNAKKRVCGDCEFLRELLA